jgi:hypothetical protein
MFFNSYINTKTNYIIFSNPTDLHDFILFPYTHIILHSSINDNDIINNKYIKYITHLDLRYNNKITLQSLYKFTNLLHIRIYNNNNIIGLSNFVNNKNIHVSIYLHFIYNKLDIVKNIHNITITYSNLIDGDDYNELDYFKHVKKLIIYNTYIFFNSKSLLALENIEEFIIFDYLSKNDISFLFLLKNIKKIGSKTIPTKHDLIDFKKRNIIYICINKNYCEQYC